MNNVLVINSGINGAASNSNKLTEQFVAYSEEVPGTSVVEVDLTAMNLPHLTNEEMAAWQTAPEERTQEQQVTAAVSEQFISQVQNADTIVIGMPMYNFGVPSVFKAWIDRIARAGITFRYTENGPQGLLTGKKVIVMAARGGKYFNTPMDTQTQYLQNVLSFLGLNDLEFVYAEGLAMGEESFKDAFSSANKKIIELISKQAA